MQLFIQKGFEKRTLSVKTRSIRLSSDHHLGVPPQKSCPTGTSPVQPTSRGQLLSTECAGTQWAPSCYVVTSLEVLEKFRDCRTNMASCFLINSIADRMVENIQKQKKAWMYTCLLPTPLTHPHGSHSSSLACEQLYLPAAVDAKEDKHQRHRTISKHT